MAYQLPDDVIGIIKSFAQPYLTRSDWRSCGHRESALIKRYYEWQHMLYYDVQWNPMRMWDVETIACYVNSTKMIQNIIEFETKYEIFSMEEILTRWQKESLFCDLILLPSADASFI